MDWFGVVKNPFYGREVSLQLCCFSVLSALALCSFYLTVILERALSFQTFDSLKRVNNVYLLLLRTCGCCLLGDVRLSFSGELKILEDVSVID